MRELPYIGFKELIGEREWLFWRSETRESEWLFWKVEKSENGCCGEWKRTRMVILEDEKDKGWFGKSYQFLIIFVVFKFF